MARMVDDDLLSVQRYVFFTAILGDIGHQGLTVDHMGEFTFEVVEVVISALLNDASISKHEYHITVSDG